MLPLPHVIFKDSSSVFLVLVLQAFRIFVLNVAHVESRFAMAYIAAGSVTAIMQIDFTQHFTATLVLLVLF